MTEEAASAAAVVDLLADRADLIEAVTDLRWLEWGHAPEPIDREWWHAATVREAGRSGLPVTWVASDQSGALGAVGLGQFDIEERRDRSPWVLGMIVRRDRRGAGIGSLLLARLERWAYSQGYELLWVATGGAAAGFSQRCGWRSYETVDRDFEPATVLTKSHEPSRCSALPCRFRLPPAVQVGIECRGRCVSLSMSLVLERFYSQPVADGDPGTERGVTERIYASA